MRRFAAVLAVLVGVFSSSIVATASDGAVAAPANADAVRNALDWGTCENPRLQRANARCALLAVPLDHDDPDGRQIQIAVSMVPHTVPDDKYQGIMLVNPGGPGGSGLVLSILGGFVPGGAGGAYDWIGFDPRGVGDSKPALSCDPDYFVPPRPPYVPSTPGIERAWLERAKGYAQDCEAAGDDLLDHMKTTDVARDIEALRNAMGQQQINYYGFSYGTYLGQVYATVFPQRVRRMVLDSNVDPTKVWYRSNLEQDLAFERNMQIYWDWLAQYDKVYELGTTGADVEKLWYAERDRLAQSPAGGEIGPAEFNDIFLYAGYLQDLWPLLADALATWVHDRDAEPLIELYDGLIGPGDDNSYAVYLAVQCTDAPWPRNWNRWRRDNWAIHQLAPFTTWNNAWFNAPCAFWPAKPARPIDVDGEKVAPILLIGEEFDAPTPFAGSLEVRRRFPNARLVAEPGGVSHANSLGGNECVDGIVSRYLTDGTLPPRRVGHGPDAVCAPLPLPVPEPAAGTPAAAAGASLSPLLAVRGIRSR